MDETILSTIKKMIGPPEEYTGFDVDILVHINAAVNILFQNGIGPDSGLSVNADTTWSDLLGGESRYELAKTYIYLFVKSIFDPPSSGVLSANKEVMDEVLWRLSVMPNTITAVENPEEA